MKFYQKEQKDLYIRSRHKQLMTHKKKKIWKSSEEVSIQYWCFRQRAKALITQMHHYWEGTYPWQLKRCYYGNVAFETSCALILWLDTGDNSQALHGITGDAYDTRINVDICISVCVNLKILRRETTATARQERAPRQVGSACLSPRPVPQQDSSSHLSPCKLWYLEKDLLVDPRAQLMSYRNMSLHNFTANLFIHCRTKCIYFT